MRKHILPLLLILGVPALSLAAEGAAAEPDMTERMMVLVVQFGFILFAARLGGWLFEKIGMPGVLGELCTGIIIGPSCLGRLPFPGFNQGMFFLAESVKCGATPVSPELYGICTFASVVLLFLVGIETDLKLLVRYALAGGLVGLGGVVVSFAVGDLLGVYLLPTIIPGEYGIMHPACIFLGVMSTATSVSITARILSEKKKMDSAEGVTTLAAAVIDDVIGIVILAIAMGLVDAEKSGEKIAWSKIGLVAIRSIGIWLGATAVGLLCSRYIGAFLKRFEDKAQIATMALGMAMVVAGLFEEAGLAMIIGAYVLGLSLSRTDISDVIREHLQPIYKFMVPVFFVVMGMMVDLGAFTDKKVVAFGLVYTVGAILAKLIGCGLPTFLCNFNLRGAGRVGIGMIPRGEVALIVAGLGLSKGIIGNEIFGVAVLMTLLTSILPPPLLVAAFKSDKSGLRKNAEDKAQPPSLRYSFPTPEVTVLIVNRLLEEFRNDGFFINTFNINEGIHQVRKDDKSITIHRAADSVSFTCPPGETQFVRTIMIEVIAEIEQTLKALQHPIDPEQLLAAPEPQPTNGRRHYPHMRKYIKRDLIVMSLTATNKSDAIRELVNLLAKHGDVKDAITAANDVISREETMPTGLGHGIACPHARTSVVDKLTCAIAVIDEGIPFDALDGKPARIIQLTLSPEDASAPYLEFMAATSTVYSSSGRDEILNAKNADEVYNTIRKCLA